MRLDPVATLKLFRFPLVFTAMADSITGYLISFGGYEFKSKAFMTMGLVALASGGLYAFGMGLNDIADRNRDKELAPTRMLPSGRLSLRAAVVACVVVLIASAVAVYFAEYGRGPLKQRFVLWGLVVAFIVVYDCLVKIPPVMGLVRACNFLLGVATGAPILLGPGESRVIGGPYYFEMWHLALIAAPEFVYVTALTYVSTLEEGGAVDRKRLWLGASFMIAAVLVMTYWIPITGVIWRSWKWGNAQWELSQAKTPVLALLVASFLAQWIFRRAWQARDKKGIMLLVRDGIGGIIVLQVTLLMSLDMIVQGWAVAALLIPAAVSVVIFKRLA